jgi:DNA helicase HerA-like ATPase
MASTVAMSDARVGSIVGDVTTSTFRFAVEDTNLNATQYIAFDHEQDTYLAQVIQIEREVDGSGGEGEGDLLADAQIVGRRDENGRLTMPSTPPKPETPVREADPELVRSGLNMEDEGAFMGQLRGLDLPVHLDVNGLVQKHCSILAKTGAGKSYALGVLMEEMLKHDVPVVVVDPHGEHASLQAPNSSDHDIPLMRRFDVKPTSFEDAVVEFAPDQDAVPEAEPFRLDERNLSARDITELLEDGLTSAQTGTLHQAIREIDDDTYGLSDVIDSVENQSGASKWPVLHALEDLQDLGILSSEPTPIDRLVEDGQASILNLKGLAPGVQQLVVGSIAQRLFEARKTGLVPPHLFVLEEAHNFCPERHLSKAASGEIIQTIASEGRKFGMGLSVVSQRPAKVDKNVLSQCNTQIILKVTNANDLKTISKSVENLPEGIEEEIQALQVGTALVSEPSFAMPLFCEIRPRQTRHGGSSIQVVRDEEDEAPASATPDVEELEAETSSPEPAEERQTSTSPEPVDPPETDTPRDPEPSSEPSAAQTTSEPEPMDAGEAPATLIEVARAEELIAEADLADLEPGALERLLVQLETLMRVLDDRAAGGNADQARIAGLRSGLKAQHRRVREHLYA